jgi:MoaD family protein
MRVRFFATFRPIVGAVELDVPLADGATIDELVDWIAERYPEVGAKLRNPDGSPSRQAHVYVDGRSARWLEDGMATRLRADQRVDVFPAVAGG